MLLPDEAKRIKLFSVSFVAQKDLDKYIESNRLNITVTRSGNKSIYKPSIEDINLKNWENLLNWIKQAGIIIYVEKDNNWKIYRWRKEKSKLNKTRILNFKPKKRLKKYKEFKIENPDKPDKIKDIRGN